MIVHVTDVFAPRLGGIEIQVAGLSAAQCSADEQVCVLTTTPDGGSGRDDFSSGYPAYRTTVGQAGRFLAHLQPQVVHVHLSVVSPLGWVAIQWALRSGVPTVATVHSLWDRPTRVAYRRLARHGRWAHRLVVTAVSDCTRELVDEAIPGLDAVTVANAITLSRWRTTPRRHHNTGEVHVVAVGRLAPRRRPIALLDVLRIAERRLRPGIALRATVAGDGPLRPAMTAYLQLHGMTGRVHLAGSLEPAALAALLGSADVLLNPVRREAFGIATLEARTAGVPVIALAGTGVADFVRHDVEGLLCASTDDLVDSLVALAENADVRGRIAAHNHSTSPTLFDWPAVLDQFDDCYARASVLADSEHR
ncbi:glycosyltransferase family 4 protein [Nocardia sp. CA-128927]|uniref:glycosyltransferase family 4 protein n=1 Tax=Nocardia sp. CA-128927 TaxID=3239975 RepID=UPI003D965F1A